MDSAPILRNQVFYWRSRLFNRARIVSKEPDAANPKPNDGADTRQRFSQEIRIHQRLASRQGRDKIIVRSQECLLSPAENDAYPTIAIPFRASRDSLNCEHWDWEQENRKPRRPWIPRTWSRGIYCHFEIPGSSGYSMCDQQPHGKDPEAAGNQLLDAHVQRQRRSIHLVCPKGNTVLQSMGFSYLSSFRNRPIEIIPSAALNQNELPVSGPLTLVVPTSPNHCVT